MLQKIGKTHWLVRFNPASRAFFLSLTMTICFICSVLAGNLVANILRNLWTFMIIFCGHFTADSEVFHKSVLDNELPGHWYLRQLRGSSNLKGGKLFHILSGNLSHLIEHHLFPTVPARRCATMSVKCKRFTESLVKTTTMTTFTSNLDKLYSASFANPSLHRQSL